MALVGLALAGGAAAVRGQSADGFDPNANGAVEVVVVQPDGKILIGGDFTTLSPNGGVAVTRNHIARLNPDGTLSTEWRSKIISQLHSERSNNSRTALYHHAHSVGLDHRDRCLWRNEFAFGDNIDNMIGEAGFSAWSQNRERRALHSGHQREWSRKFAWHAGQRWAWRIRGHESKSAIQTRAR